MQAAGLTARNLFCRRGDRPLFGALDLDVAPGGAVRLTGPNGIGKTSLLQILAGLRAPSPVETGKGVTRGTVAWGGGIAMLDQRPALDREWPLARALDFWGGLDGRRVPLAQVGLAGLEDVPVRYLSTGQTRRAALARLIQQDARHWLLDEPLNGLDDAGVALVERLIARRRADGGVVIVASHQPIACPGARVVDLRAYRW